MKDGRTTCKPCKQVTGIYRVSNKFVNDFKLQNMSLNLNVH